MRQLSPPPPPLTARRPFTPGRHLCHSHSHMSLCHCHSCHICRGFITKKSRLLTARRVSCSSSPLSSSCMVSASCIATSHPKTHRRALGQTQRHIYNLAPRARHALQSAAASISHAHRGAGIWRPLRATCSRRVAVRVGRDKREVSACDAAFRSGGRVFLWERWDGGGAAGAAGAAPAHGALICPIHSRRSGTSTEHRAETSG